MKKKASAVIICLWVLVVLTMLAVGIGHRVSMALRLSRYQKDKLIASYLAKAGVERAIFEIINDQTANLGSKWLDNEKVFKEIRVGANEEGFATVSYVTNDGFHEETIFGVVDEERKINLNTAPRGLLEKMLDYVKADNYLELANNICGWRGDPGVTVPDAEYQSLGYTNKGKWFSNIQELKLVKGMTPEIYKSLENLITVHSSGKININTAPPQTLEILKNFIISQTDSPTPNLSSLAETIMKLRGEKVIFDSSFATQLGLGEDEASIVNNSNLLDVKSTCFFITSNGKIEKNGFTQTLSVIFDRNNQGIVYRYEG